MDKRYQVFISSTYQDLKEERKAIIESLLNAKYIPAGMEMFSASNDEQFKYIKKIVDDCDYYVLLIGGRYGSINPSTGLSFTEQEYEYAKEKKIPILVFLYDDPYNLSAEKRDDENRELLSKFREKVSNNRLCKMWHTTSELVASVIISLGEEVADNPQLGWTRGSGQDVTELLVQINELRIEKNRLDNEILSLNTIIGNIQKTDGLANGQDWYTIVGETKIPGRRKANGIPDNEYVETSIDLTWDDIFSLIGPYLISSVNYKNFCSILTDAINSKYETANFSIIKNDCIQTIKVQLQALGLIEYHTITEKGFTEFITLSNKGKEYLIQLKSIKKKI